MTSNIFDAGAAFRVWAARHGLAPTATAAQVADISTKDEYIDFFEDTFGNLDASLSRAVNARKVHAISVNQKESLIIAYLNKKFTAKQIKSLPSQLDEFRIEYRQGTIGHVGGTPPASIGTPNHYVHNNRITCGSSIGLGGSLGVGTLGVLLRINDELFGLSNNHVIGRCSYAESGHPVLAPGNLDISPNILIHPFSIGIYEASAPMVNGLPTTVDISGNLDAAVMGIVDPNKVSALQGSFYVTPGIVAPLTDGMSVQKVGRTTGHTQGVITGKVAGAQSVLYTVPELQQQFTVFFNEAWIAEGVNGAFSDAGDSGSLVVGTLPNGELASVGLVFAGNGTISLIVPLDLILSVFGATIDATHGV
ncbi:MAG: S1 family peptidase [Gammaproteobacteria bacterium]|jgi:hypothetical protein|nr:S1 family peptidase [Gammaproteobacteria bacterium]